MCNLKYVFPKFTVKHKSSNTNRYNLQEIKTDQHHSFMDIGQIGELLPANHHSNNVLLSLKCYVFIWKTKITHRHPFIWGMRPRPPFIWGPVPPFATILLINHLGRLFRPPSIGRE